MTNFVPIHVPEEYVAEVYDLLARRMGGNQLADEPIPTPPPPVDEALAVRMYEDSFARHRRLLTYLADRSDRWVSSRELTQALELPSGSKSVAGMFGAFGRRAKHRYGGAKPWDVDWDRENGEGRYRMKADVAAWIEKAASAHHQEGT